MQHAKTYEGYVIAGTFSEWAAGVPAHRKNAADFQHYVDRYPPDDPETLQFFGVPSIGKLIDMADKGWAEGVENLQKLEESIRHRVADKLFKIRKRRRLVRRGSGNDYDVHAGLQGRHDKAWTVSESTMHREGAVKHGKTVDICMTLGANCGTHASGMFYPAACALVSARILIAAGYHVRMFASWHSYKPFKSGSAPRFLQRFVMLSNYGEMLDMHGASLLSHGGFCRFFVMMFGIFAAPYVYRKGFGQSQRVTYGVMEEGLKTLGMRPGDNVMASPHPGSASHLDAESAADFVVNDMLGSLV